MRILYFDCFSGISGDMAVGALRDLGVDEEVFRRAVGTLGLGDEIHLHFGRGERQRIAGVSFHVHAHDHGHGTVDAHGHDHGDHGDHDHSHGDHAHGRTHREIRRLIEASRLEPEVKRRALSVFQRIAVAEGKIHGVPPEDVGFHEVGAADSIADIVAACAGFHALGPLRIEASPLVEGRGWIECAHGSFPLPAPATLEILAGIPLGQVDEPGERITPTGAALIAEFAERFGPFPPLRVERVGHGLGTRDTPGRPNVLRAVLGEAVSNAVLEGAETDEVDEIETNLDDMTPELAAAAARSAFAAGAIEAFFTPVQMKKGRPGFLLTALCPPESTGTVVRVLLTETSAFGVRIHRVQRQKLRREIRNVETPHGPIAVKFGFLGESIVQRTPEYESCAAAARASGIPLRDVVFAAEKSARSLP